MSVHRTRKRGKPSAPAKAAKVELDDAELDLRELLILWPRLEAALARDGAGPSAAPSGSGGGAKAGSPAVTDIETQEVLTLIDLGVHQLESEAIALLRITPAGRVLTGLRAELAQQRAERAKPRALLLQLRRRLDTEAPVPYRQRELTADERANAQTLMAAVQAADERIAVLQARIRRVEYRRSTVGVIEQLPLWYAQLKARKQPLADHIGEDARRWCRAARQVLRLRTHEIPLGWTCPYHRLEPAELIRDRDEATLSDAILAGRTPAKGEAPLTWRYAEAVHCPHCGKKWCGIEQLRVLMKMIDQVQEDEMMRDRVLDVVRRMASSNIAGGAAAPLWKNELELLTAIGVEVRTCSAGCGCRRGTDDPDRLDCACAGECTGESGMDDPPDDWDDFELALPEPLRVPVP